MAARAAALAVDRAHGDDALRARLMTETGSLKYTANEYRDALLDFQAAEKLWSSSVGPGSSQFANTLRRIGITLKHARPDPRGGGVSRALAGGSPGDPPARSHRHRRVAERSRARPRLSREVQQGARLVRGRAWDRREAAGSPAPGHSLHPADHRLGRRPSSATTRARSRSSPARGATKARDVSGGLYYIVKADIQYGAGLDAQAEQSLRLAMKHYAGAGFPDHVNTGYALTGLGLLHNRRGRFRQGLRACRRAIATLTKEMDPTSHLLSETRACVGEALIGAGAFASARKELEGAVAAAKDGECGLREIATLRFHLARAIWPMKATGRAPWRWPDRPSTGSRLPRETRTSFGRVSADGWPSTPFRHRAESARPGALLPRPGGQQSQFPLR